MRNRYLTKSTRYETNKMAAGYSYAWSFTKHTTRENKSRFYC